MCYNIGLFLFFFGVDEKGSAGHGCHIAVFAAYIDVNCSIVELVIITVVLEFVHCDVIAGLDHDRGQILEEVSADTRVVFSKLSNCFVNF